MKESTNKKHITQDNVIDLEESKFLWQKYMSVFIEYNRSGNFSRYARKHLFKIQNQLSEFNRYKNIENLPLVLQKQYCIIVDDFKSIIDALPITYHDYDNIAKINRLAYNGADKNEIVEPLIAKLQELLSSIESFTKQLSEVQKMQGQKLSQLELQSTKNNLIQFSRLNSKQISIVSQAQNKIEEYSIIQRGRAERFLANIKQAQQLEQQLKKNNTTTINGESIYAVVDRIVSDNINQLEMQVTNSSDPLIKMNEVAAHDLELLDIYSKGLSQ